MPALLPTASDRRIKVDRFGDCWPVHTGANARRIRREIEREQEALLSRRDAGEDVPLLTHEGLEEEVGRRLASNARTLEAAE